MPTGMNLTPQKKLRSSKKGPFSVKRLLGAALFGCLIVAYAKKACDYTMPTIVSMLQGIDASSAADQYSSSAMFPFLAFAFGAVLGSMVAALLARRYAVLAGLLANSPFALLFLVLAVAGGGAGLVGNTSYSFRLYGLLLLVTVVLASLVGALIGQQISGTWNPDLNQSKVTVFGVRWAHYFWILPLVVYPYLASLIIAIYAGVLAFLSSFYFALNPSLWFSFGWAASYSRLSPIAVYCAFWLVFQEAWSGSYT